jgi:hypothetical protein
MWRRRVGMWRPTSVLGRGAVHISCVVLGIAWPMHRGRQRHSVQAAQATFARLLRVELAERLTASCLGADLAAPCCCAYVREGANRIVDMPVLVPCVIEESWQHCSTR